MKKMQQSWTKILKRGSDKKGERKQQKNGKCGNTEIAEITGNDNKKGKRKNNLKRENNDLAEINK